MSASSFQFQGRSSSLKRKRQRKGAETDCTHCGGIKTKSLSSLLDTEASRGGGGCGATCCGWGAQVFFVSIFIVSNMFSSFFFGGVYDNKCTVKSIYI